MKNKESRAEKISSKVRGVQKQGKMTLQDAQEIHGLLNFANGYFSGRALKYACFKIFSLVQRGAKPLIRLEEWCNDVVAFLQESKPRRVPLGLDTNTVLAFTDGSWEDGKAGWERCSSMSLRQSASRPGPGPSRSSQPMERPCGRPSDMSI